MKKLDNTDAHTHAGQLESGRCLRPAVSVRVVCVLALKDRIGTSTTAELQPPFRYVYHNEGMLVRPSSVVSLRHKLLQEEEKQDKGQGGDEAKGNKRTRDNAHRPVL